MPELYDRPKGFVVPSEQAVIDARWYIAHNRIDLAVAVLNKAIKLIPNRDKPDSEKYKQMQEELTDGNYTFGYDEGKNGDIGFTLTRREGDRMIVEVCVYGETAKLLRDALSTFSKNNECECRIIEEALNEARRMTQTIWPSLWPVHRTVDKINLARAALQKIRRPIIEEARVADTETASSEDE